ncbi:MBL fold metallo-hydrolase RNA specificity domain-containing protein [Pseudomonas fontis]|uniref:MBL fold metallo-hydrolase n=1 Tax=Pseudomonas fontis TaxID=2942633 RepID=A0ABT5NVF2_9PSED|nr:MBL fold metallo-hydrolase [Pseudomonas fontis]MDD0975546.1 MBL fold metallo-hydrolase [Pseudomonas fontis]MDD0992162.1 MBL fold metallo-hydrolase [Pseudomonas fontis]
MDYPFIVHHGATSGVSGSCHQLHLDATRSLLVDCGLFQGVESCPAEGLGFTLGGVEALLVTHVHLDHVGRIPALLAAGYEGPIICSEPSAALLPIVLEDAFRLEISRNPARVKRYVQQIEQAILPLPFGTWYDLVESAELSCRVRLQPAGHVLGSAYIECDVCDLATGSSQRIIFSGDLGSGRNPMLSAPVSPERADTLVLESTYGNRVHDSVNDRQQALERVIERALLDQGTILIPAFSVGRTQELLYEIEAILHRKSLVQAGGRTAEGPVDWPQLPVILDSPLAGKMTRAYRQLNEFWSDCARQRLLEGRAPLGFSQLISIETVAQHQTVVNYLASTGRPAIVIAGNGMCSGGRIVNYLKAMLGSPRHEVVFTGYQAKGTPGAVIKASEGASGFVKIDLDAQMYEINAKVITLTGYSAHADQAGLLGFVSAMSGWPSKVVLVHGSEGDKQGLAAALQGLYRQAGKQVVTLIPS